MPNDVLNVIMQQMIKAEELYNNFQNFGKKFSENKLEEVLMKVENYCLNAGIKYDEAVVKEYIDKLIDFSKFNALDLNFKSFILAILSPYSSFLI